MRRNLVIYEIKYKNKSRTFSTFVATIEADAEHHNSFTYWKLGKNRHT